MLVLPAMRSLVVVAAVLAASAATAAPAFADAKIIKLGPRGDDTGVAEALAEANEAMAVCGRGSVRDETWSAEVKVEVHPDGTMRATPVGGGAISACAAGIMGVWQLPPSDGWAAVIRFTGARAVDLSALIQGRFMERSAKIKACQSKAPSAAGSVTIKMKVQPSGAMTDVEVTSSLGAALNGCVKDAVKSITLDKIPTRSPIGYALSVAFAGKGADSGPPPPVEAPDGGTVAGGLDVNAVKTVMSGARTKLQACGKKGKGKGVVTTRFTVRPDGTTKNVVIKQGIGDAAIEACLVAAFKDLSFPSSGDETKISYPVKF